jgi:hypothetical protein
MWVYSFPCWGSDFPTRSRVLVDSNPWERTSSWEVRGSHFKLGHSYEQIIITLLPGNGGYCHIRIPQFGLVPKPLCEALWGPEEDLLHWAPEMGQVLQSLKQALTIALTLALPDLRILFSIYVHERRETVLGVCGTHQLLCSILVKSTIPSSSKMAPCLRALASLVLLVGETSKLILGQKIIY